MDMFVTDQSPLSDASSSTTTSTAHGGGFISDAETLLATSRRKRRAGTKIFQETRHPVYRGARKRNGDKWVREPNKKSRIWPGIYPTPEIAARAHDVAALALRGKSACLNFTTDSAWRLPVPASADAAEIRRVAGHINSGESCSKECKNLKESVLFIDEEEVFDMPRLLAEMAEGPLLSPPVFNGDGSNEWNLLENYFFDLSLWSN